jgi:hypothetical protein
MHLPQNGGSLFVGTMKFPLPVAFIVSKPIGTQLSSVHCCVDTMNFVDCPRVRWLWEKAGFYLWCFLCIASVQMNFILYDSENSSCETFKLRN